MSQPTANCIVCIIQLGLVAASASQQFTRFFSDTDDTKCRSGEIRMIRPPRRFAPSNTSRDPRSRGGPTGETGMLAIKTVLAVSALASASAFSALTACPEAEARASFSERFPMSSQMLVPPTKAADDRTGQQVSADRKGDKVAALDSLCAGQQ